MPNRSRSPIQTQNPWQDNFSEMIDVRSEGEFAEDRIPGAINLPVLSDREREKVGTLYKQVSPFEAKKVGAALVSKNISRHLTEHFANKDRDYSPLIYCWRGGQRSNSLAAVLTQIGWQVSILAGGYKTYRTAVRDRLQKLPQQFNYQVLCGLTGTGKTHLLQRMAQQRWQVLDLEALAKHRGSLLGQQWEDSLKPQPSQKWFESQLLQKLQQFDPQQMVWVESESNKIGQIYLPPTLWQKMKESPCVEIQLPLEERVSLLMQDYSHFAEQTELLASKISRLKCRHGTERIKYWNRLIKSDRGREFVRELLTVHYDPAYRRSIAKTFQPVKSSIELTDLSNASLDRAIAQFDRSS